MPTFFVLLFSVVPALHHHSFLSSLYERIAVQFWVIHPQQLLLTQVISSHQAV
jgi:hypothetical protein